jgi:hypothetical protein
MNTRYLYMVLSSGSLPYARLAIESLYRRSAEPVHLHLITDSAEDRQSLAEFMGSQSGVKSKSWSIYSAGDLEERASEHFARYPNLRAFRKGHPCWRKLTDPLLIAAPGEEIIVLDPDLFFPNRFIFEATPISELLLMWQRPNCLLPSAVVRAAIKAGIPLANHVDIGVAQWRGPSDVEWLDWLIGGIGGSSLPRVMHIEAIVWSALAMKMGGGYLDRTLWRCWHRTQIKRVKRLLKVAGPQILRTEPWNEMKCFHGGGEAKWWMPEALKSGYLTADGDTMRRGHISPFTELTAGHYSREQSIKRVLRGMGYYSLFRPA